MRTVAPRLSRWAVSSDFLESEPDMGKFSFKRISARPLNADAADADEMNVQRLIKIYLIHKVVLPFSSLLLYGAVSMEHCLRLLYLKRVENETPSYRIGNRQVKCHKN